MEKGPGRPKGSPNKITTELKTAIIEAFESVGGVEYLVKVAEDDPKTFCGLLAKILPKDMNVSTTQDRFEQFSDEDLHQSLVDGMRDMGYVLLSEEEAEEAGVLKPTEH